MGKSTQVTDKIFKEIGTQTVDFMIQTVEVQKATEVKVPKNLESDRSKKVQKEERRTKTMWSKEETQ